MQQQYIFPTVLIILQIGAGIVYGIIKDWWTAAYWVAAAVLNVAVTFKP